MISAGDAVLLDVADDFDEARLAVIVVWVLNGADGREGRSRDDTPLFGETTNPSSASTSVSIQRIRHHRIAAVTISRIVLGVAILAISTAKRHTSRRTWPATIGSIEPSSSASHSRPSGSIPRPSPMSVRSPTRLVRDVPSKGRGACQRSASSRSSAASRVMTRSTRSERRSQNRVRHRRSAAVATRRTSPCPNGGLGSVHVRGNVQPDPDDQKLRALGVANRFGKDAAKFLPARRFDVVRPADPKSPGWRTSPDSLQRVDHADRPSRSPLVEADQLRSPNDWGEDQGEGQAAVIRPPGIRHRVPTGGLPLRPQTRRPDQLTRPRSGGVPRCSSSPPPRM